MRISNKLIYFLHKHKKIRKRKEENLPPWKEKLHQFNEKHLKRQEIFVERMIPLLIVLLLLIIFGEFSHTLNFFNWNWMEQVAGFFSSHEDAIYVIDQIIIAFFVVDLYFSFFKKKTFIGFLKHYFLDILAVAPFGLVFRLTEIGEAQAILHVSTDIER